ncbi:MAG: AraC family transcriptional regulator [Gammaproteobacteria bacterium]|nr:AraC family transcriptional regulator [Gammaproteobacteria bacterium]
MDIEMVSKPEVSIEMHKVQQGEQISPFSVRAQAQYGTSFPSVSVVVPFEINLQLAAVASEKPIEKRVAKSPKVESFASLDSEAEKLLKEVLNLSSDLAILDEQHANPAKNQLLVLVTLEPSRFFDLDYVELKVDGQVVAAHPYSEKEISAMVRGGGHRLYLANLPAGMHHLKAVFVGKVPRDPDYQREASFTFISGVDRTVIELYVNSTESNGFPRFTIKEYN